MEQEIKEYDLKVKKYLQECLQTSNNDIERKTIKYCLKLSNIYSFSRTQTYPRPRHHLKSKQKRCLFYDGCNINITKNNS